MKLFTYIVGLILPHISYGRNYYDLIRQGYQILVHNGIKAFSQSVNQHIFTIFQFYDYQKWIKVNEPSNKTLIQLKENSQSFSYRPKISIITPVWNVDEKWFRLCIDSVINQIYDNWELCLVDGNSTKPHIKKVLSEYSRKDSRIIIQFSKENKGIAGNSQEALALATGEFIGLLDHDDELANFALFEVVRLLNKNSSLSYIYSDEDKINEKGVRKNPFFKPDWSPDMFYSINYLCHFSVIRARLLHKIGGFHEGYDGSQDYDLFLRVTENLPENQIAHIPKILYHWRMIPESASLSESAKPYVYNAAKKAIADSLKRKKIPIEGVLDGYWVGSFRVQYQIKTNPEVTIIIPTKDHVEFLKQCIDSIVEKTNNIKYKIYIIDNQSELKETEHYYQSLEKNQTIRVFRYNHSFNFSAMINCAVEQVTSPYLVFIHYDTEVITEEWLSAMLEHAQFDDVGAVGGLLVYPDNTIQHAGLIIGNPHVAINSHNHIPYELFGYFGRARIIHNVSAVGAACMMMRTDLFNEIGKFDTDLAVAYNDVDLCLRLRENGYRIIFTPYTQLYHYVSLNKGFGKFSKNEKKFEGETMIMRKRWGQVIEKGDPYYNINLTTEKEDFSIKLSE